MSSDICAMKKLSYLFVFFILAVSCQKGEPVPSAYLGTWVAESSQLLATANRIHTLKITNESKGARGRYTSKGNTDFWDEDIAGKVKIEDGKLHVKGKEFDLNETPHENEDGEIQMKLGTLVFIKQ